MGMFDLGDDIPRAGTAFSRWIGRAVFRWRGWKIEGALPNVPKMVVVVAPHTSNWDFCVAMCAVRALNLRVSWLGKNTLFWWPMGRIFTHLGGIPVDRASPHGMVGQIIAAFDRRDKLVVAITPEGTRKRGSAWKRGFYHMAQGAGVPIATAGLDYARKILEFGPVLMPTGDVDVDIQSLQEFFGGLRGKRVD